MMTQACRTSYLDESQLEKLSELRAKTDQQLQGLVHSTLDAGLRFAALGGIERAARALADVQRLLPALNEEQRRAFDSKRAELREALAIAVYKKPIENRLAGFDPALL
jgi:hypothetical protein